jgi:hypothetical protein
VFWQVTDPWRTMHWLGQPILPSDIIQKMIGSMKDVHEAVLYLEYEFLKMDSLMYLLFVAKVPTGMGFDKGIHSGLMTSSTSST